MLFKDLLKNTWLTHPDYENLKTAFLKMENLALKINEKKRESESIGKVFEVQRQLRGFSNLCQPWRRFVHEGPSVWVKSNSSSSSTIGQSGNPSTIINCQLYLFNDILIIAIPNPKKGNFKHKTSIEIDEHFTASQFEDTKRQPNLFRIKTKKKEYFFAASSQAEREEWVSNFVKLNKKAKTK